MAWVWLILGGLFEVGFTTSLRFVEGFRNLPWTLVFLVSVGLSMALLEYAARTDMIAAIAQFETVKDYVSRDMVSSILEDTEAHIDFLETELGLVEKVGLHNYLQTQIGEGNEGGS